MPGKIRPNYRQEISSVLGVGPFLEGVEPPEEDKTDIRLLAATTALRAIAKVRRGERLAAQKAGTLPQNLIQLGPEERAAASAEIHSWNQRWELTAERREQALAIGGDTLQLMAEHAVIAHNIALAAQEPVNEPKGADAPETPRARFQTRVGKRIDEHLMRPPKPSSLFKTPTDQLGRPLVVVAHTGTGKTVMEANALRRAGVGQVVNGKRIRGLVILSSQKAMKHYGNPNDTFRRFLGDASVSTIWQDSKDGTGDVVAVSRHSLGAAIEEGLIDPNDFAITIMDEGHRALAQKMAKQLDVLGTRLLFFTATPYNQLGDLRAFYPYYEEESLRESVESGMLNPVRLRSFRAGPEKDSAEMLAARRAVHHIQAGRKFVVYCQPGGKSSQADRVARLINHIMTTEKIIPHPNMGWKPGMDFAKLISSYQGDVSEEALEQFDAGQLCGLTTTGMLEESWDPKRLDAAIFIGPERARRRMIQRIGRTLRLSAEGIVTDLDEIIPYKVHPGKRLFSIFAAFGLENVNQGIIIGNSYLNKILGEEKLISNVTSELEHTGQNITDDLDDDEAADRGLTTTLTTREDVPLPAELTAAPGPAAKLPTEEAVPMPAELLAAQIPNQPLRYVVIAPEDIAKAEPPEGYGKQSAALATTLGVPRAWLEGKLDNANVPYAGIRPLTDTGFGDYERWYLTDAVDHYLKTNSIPKLAELAELTLSDVEELTGVSDTYLKQIKGRRPEIVGKERLGRNYRKTRVYDLADFAIFVEEVEKIPLADKDEITLGSLGERVNYWFVSQYYARPENTDRAPIKRRNPIHGIKGFERHVTPEEADRCEAAYNEIPPATDAFMSIPTVAEKAGIAYVTALKGYETAANSIFPDNTKPPLQPMRLGKGGPPSNHLPKEAGEALAEHLKRDELPPHLVTIPMLRRRTGMETSTLLSRLSHAKPLDDGSPRFPTEKRNLAGSGGQTICVGWDALFYLDGIYPPGEDAIKVTPEVVARHPDDTETRIAKSKALHKTLAPPQKKAPGGSVRKTAPAKATPSPESAPAPPAPATGSPASPSPSQPPPDTPSPAQPVQPAAEALPKTPDAPRWHDAGTLPELLRCSPIALRFLLAASRPADTELQRADNMIISVHNDVIKRVATYAARLASAPVSWASHTRLAAHLKIDPDRLEAHIKAKGIATNQRGIFRGDTGEIDIYYDQRAWRALIPND